MMIGRELSAPLSEERGGSWRNRPRNKGLTRIGEFEGIDLTVRKGEILGLGGLVGSGRTEIARVLFGITQPTSGSIRINGKEMRFANASAAMAAGVAYVSEDRLGQSLVMDFPIVDNAALTMLDSTTTAGFSSRQKVLDRVAPHLDRLKLRFQQLRSADQHAFRRQPAEGRAGEMAGDQPATPDPRRTDAGHRRAVEGRSACDDRRSRQAGHGDHSDLVGDARASWHVRPHRGPARRPSDG